MRLEEEIGTSSSGLSQRSGLYCELIPYGSMYQAQASWLRGKKSVAAKCTSENEQSSVCHRERQKQKEGMKDYMSSKK